DRQTPLEAVHLVDAESCLDVGHPVLVARTDDRVSVVSTSPATSPRVAIEAVIAKDLNLLRPLGITSEDHAALPRRHVLACAEAVNRDVSLAGDRAAPITRLDGMRA